MDSKIRKPISVLFDASSELLWTNPSPTSVFNAQKISLDLSNYDAVNIEYKHYSSSYPIEAIANEIGFVGGCCGGYSVQYVRGAKVETDGVTFSDACQSGGTNNNTIIPCKIYGIKLSPSLKCELVWTNPSPTSNFVAQSVSVDLSKYKMVCVEFKTHTSKPNDSTYQSITVIGCGVGINVNGNVRGGSTSVGGIAFSNCISNNSGNVINDNFIPMRIYGIGR